MQIFMCPLPVSDGWIISADRRSGSNTHTGGCNGAARAMKSGVALLRVALTY